MAMQGALVHFRGPNSSKADRPAGHMSCTRGGQSAPVRAKRQAARVRAPCAANCKVCRCRYNVPGQKLQDGPKITLVVYFGSQRAS